MQPTALFLEGFRFSVTELFLSSLLLLPLRWTFVCLIDCCRNEMKEKKKLDRIQRNWKVGRRKENCSELAAAARGMFSLPLYLLVRTRPLLQGRFWNNQSWMLWHIPIINYDDVFSYLFRIRRVWTIQLFPFSLPIACIEFCEWLSHSWGFDFFSLGEEEKMLQSGLSLGKLQNLEVQIYREWRSVKGVQVNVVY